MSFKILRIALSLVIPIHLVSQTFGLRDILSAPYCSDLTKSADGEAIAWINNERGIRTIYTANTSDFKTDPIFSTQMDDGQVISSVKFSNDRKFLYFVHGSGPNRAGEAANPLSSISYPKRLIKRIDLENHKIDTVGVFSSFILSTDDKFLLIAKGNQLFKFDSETLKKEVLITMRGTFSNVRFSPDTKSIVFISSRGDHSYIGTYTFGDDRIQWVAPGVDKDILPQWSPEGNQIVFIRTPGTRKGELRNITGGIPFEIVLADLESGSSKTIWKSPADDGGFAQYYPSNPISWTKSGKIIFYSEHEGWMKIYSMNADGSNLNSIIQGNCEVEHSSTNASGNKVLFSTNCGDIDRRDIYEFDLITNRLSQITDTDLIETDPLYVGDKHIIFRVGGHNFPTRIDAHSSGKTRTIFPEHLSERYPVREIVKPEQVIFTASDGTEIHGQLFTNGKYGNKPGVLFMHGGPIRQMLLGYHYSSYYANAYAMNQYLANQGYAVISVNFRAGIGYGRAFRRAADQGPRGASEYQDIVAAAKYLQQLDYVDADRIGLWGGSYGGLLTAQGLARNSDIFKAGVDLHGVHDWAWRATDFSPGGAWGIDKSLMDLALESSPVADIDGWISPVLFVHGDDDRNVMYGQTVDLVQRLREKGVEHEILVFPDEVHGFYRYESWLRTFEAAAKFFDRHLLK